MNTHLEDERDKEMEKHDREPSEADEALREYISDRHTQEWTP